MIKTLRTVLLKSAYYFLAILAFDSILLIILYLIRGFSFAIYIFGASIFLETAALFIAGGIADFTESYSSVNLRNFIGKKKLSYSAEKHRKTQLTGASLVLAGVWFIALSLLMFILHIQ